MSADFDPGALRYDPHTGLVPAIVQDSSDGVVLMLGYMSEDSVRRTLDTGRVTFFSRSRRSLWEKGATSGHTLELVSIVADCDSDALLVHATPRGPTCHTGGRSCFGVERDIRVEGELGGILAEVAAVIGERDRQRPPGSYTTRLLEAGPARVGQKVAEEAVEAALAAVADPGRVAEESADLLYHLLVLWQASGVAPADVAAELRRRRCG